MRDADNDVLLVGLCTVDLVQRVQRNPQVGEKVQANSVETAAGGPASHAAVAVAALGGQATLATALGHHPLAELARGDLTVHGVRVLDAAPHGTDPPTVSAVHVREEDGERTVVSHNAAGVRLDVPEDLDEAVRGSRAVLLDGHHPELTRAAAGAAHRAGVPVVLDAGSYKPVLHDVLPQVDVCACSAGFRLPGHDARSDTDEQLWALGVGALVRTAGSGPVNWSYRSSDGAHRAGTVQPPRTTARDTLAAGDVWHGAIVHAIARLGRVPSSDDLPGLVRTANDVAAVRVAHVGTRSWVETLRKRGS